MQTARCALRVPLKRLPEIRRLAASHVVRRRENRGSRRRKHPYDLIGHAGQRNGTADDRRIRAEVTTPQVFGEHDDVRTAGLFVRLNKTPPQDRT